MTQTRITWPWLYHQMWKVYFPLAWQTSAASKEVYGVHTDNSTGGSQEVPQFEGVVTCFSEHFLYRIRMPRTVHFKCSVVLFLKLWTADFR